MALPNQCVKYASHCTQRRTQQKHDISTATVIVYCLFLLPFLCRLSRSSIYVSGQPILVLQVTSHRILKEKIRKESQWKFILLTATIDDAIFQVEIFQFCHCLRTERVKRMNRHGWKRGSKAIKMIIHIVLSVDFAIICSFTICCSNKQLFRTSWAKMPKCTRAFIHTTAWARVMHYPRMTDRMYLCSSADDQPESSSEIADHINSTTYFPLVRFANERYRRRAVLSSMVAGRGRCHFHRVLNSFGGVVAWSYKTIATPRRWGPFISIGFRFVHIFLAARL